MMRLKIIRHNPVVYIALIFWLIQIPGQAFQYNPDSLLHELSIATLPSQQIILNNLLARSFLEKDPAKAGEYARKALFLSESINNEVGKAEALFYLAVIASDRLDYNEAYENFQIAQQIFHDKGDDKWLAKVNLEFSDEFKRRLEFEKALDLLFKSLDVFTLKEKKNKIAETQNKIGGNYYDMGDFAKAGDYFEKSLTLYENLGDKEKSAEIIHNLGETYRKREQYDEALRYFKQTIPTFTELEKYNSLATTYDNMGNVYISLSRVDSADYYLDKGYRLAIQLKSLPLMAAISISRGYLKLEVNQPDSAKALFMRALETAKKYSRLQYVRDASLGLSEVFEKTSQFDSAYFYHVRYKLISDSITNIRNQQKIAQAEMTYLYEHEQQALTIKQQDIRLKYFSIAGALSLILVVLVLFYGRQKIKAKHTHIEEESLRLEQKRLQEEIDYKNRELTTHVMYLVKKNELISFISERLLKTKPYFTVENKKKLQQIISNLLMHHDKNIWEQFEQRFNEVHKNFYTNLNEKFPDLTENDRKLAAFLRLNLSTKEISLILHQNPNSIEVARTRLRKKLNISGKDVSLTSFLSQL